VTKPRIGPRQREPAAIVSALPGISKAGLLRRAGLPTRGYGCLRPVARAEAAGLITVDSGYPCRLFTTEADNSVSLDHQVFPPPTAADGIQPDLGRA
jgi:hypothetical protein